MKETIFLEVKNTVKKSNDVNDEKAKKKKIKIPKILKSKRKSKKADKIYESLENEEQINPLGSTEVVETYDEDIEETCKYMGKKVHLEVLPESYDLLEESGYETTTDSPVNCEDSEFWSFEDLQLSEEDEEDRLTVKDRFRRAWKNESMKSVRKVSLWFQRVSFLHYSFKNPQILLIMNFDKIFDLYNQFIQNVFPFSFKKREKLNISYLDIVNIVVQ